MKQLKLSEEQLLEIGFSKKKYPAIPATEDDPYGSVNKTLFEIPTINGCFTYSNAEDVYVWYHKTVIGQAANFVHLDIKHKVNLFTVLSVFKAKFNLVIT